MSNLLEDMLPGVKSDGLITNKDATFGGTTTFNGSMVIAGGQTETSSNTTGAIWGWTGTGIYTGTGMFAVTANSVTTGTIVKITGTGLTTGPALAVAGPSSALVAFGANGATNPAFVIDASTASSATGIKVTSAAAAAGVAIAVVSSGTNEALTIDGKGSGAVKIGTLTAATPTIGTSGAGTMLQLYAGGNRTLFTAAGGTDTWSGGASNIVINGAGAIAVRAVTTLTLQDNIAVPAGGSAAASVRLSSTATLGIYFGSGVPTVTAAQGSLYMRTDGSSTSTRMYVNTDGGTTWTAVTTAA